MTTGNTLGYHGHENVAEQAKQPRYEEKRVKHVISGNDVQTSTMTEIVESRTISNILLLDGIIEEAHNLCSNLLGVSMLTQPVPEDEDVPDRDGRMFVIARLQVQMERKLDILNDIIVKMREV